MKNKKVFWIQLLFLSGISFSIVSYLVYLQLNDNSGRYMSDSFAHLVFLYRYFYTPDYYIPHPLWHISTFYLARIFHMGIEEAASISSGLFMALWTALVYCISVYELRDRSRLLPLLTTFIAITIGPLCIPWYNRIIFLGQGSPNIWHNVTLWTVKPFALLSFWYTIRFLEKTNYFRFAIIGIVSTIISLFAKPSYVIVFLPSLATYMLLNRNFHKRSLFYFFALSTTSIFILIYQYIHTFGKKGASHIILDPLGVWSLSSQNITVSILLGLAFPISFTFLESRIIRRAEIQLSWLMVFFGILYYALFAQSGKYYSHGNFGWSYMIAMSFLYLFTIIEYVRIYFKIKGWKRCILSPLLGIQAVTGIYYLLKVLQGQNPLYISIFF